MSDLELESEFDPKTRSTRFGCVVPDKSFLVDPRSIVDDVRHALGQTIYKATVDRIVPRVKQAIEDALAEEFGGRKKSEERKAGEGIESAGGKAGEVFSLWRIVSGSIKTDGTYKNSYAWAKTPEEARSLFQRHFSNKQIREIEHVFSSDFSHFLSTLETDLPLMKKNIAILPPPPN